MVMARLLEPLGTQQRVGEIDQKADGYGGPEPIIDAHSAPSEPVASVGVAHGNDEKRGR